MANYNIQISWSGKDSLADSDPLKVISGTDFQTEFEAVRTAINSKAEAADLLASIYPVGSIYMNATNSTNPSSLLGFGTWVAFGAGRVPVGFDGSDSNFDAAEKTGGSKDAIVVAHTHTGTTDSNGDHDHRIADPGEVADGGSTDARAVRGSRANGSQLSSIEGAHTHTFTTGSTGSSGTNANLQPYITVYMFKRVA